jgi:uncharacterized membrane protein
MTDLVQTLQTVAQFIALAISALVVVIVAVGALEAVAASLRMVFSRNYLPSDLRTVWLRFARWILMALEFALGADVIRSAVAPSWDDIGKLAAIAVIRTGLSFFLARDFEEARTLKPLGPRPVKTD